MLTEEKAVAFWSMVEKGDSCWHWKGSHDPSGYGRFGKPSGFAHRIAFELSGGVIPEGTEIDHICRNRGCVNPAHMRAVTHKENMANSQHALKEFCKRGHPLSGDNLRVDSRGNRHCRACLVINVRLWRERHPDKARELDRNQKRKERGYKGDGTVSKTSLPKTSYFRGVD